MKKLELFSTLIIISLLIFNVYTVLHDQESFKNPLFSFQIAKADEEGGCEYCIQNDTHQTWTVMNECETWVQYWNNCITGAQSCHCETMHQYWIDNSCAGVTSDWWEDPAHEIYLCPGM
jgi:hypothetical protein